MKRVLLSLSVFLFIFCNQSPIGQNNLKSRGDFADNQLELSPSMAFTEFKNICLGSSSNLILGKNDEYESRILLSFQFPDTSYQGLDQIKLALYRNKLFNTDTVEFSIHLLTNDFTEGKANWTTRDEAIPWLNAGGDYEQDSIRYGKVIGDTLTVYFNYLELNQLQASHGLIIIPRSEGFVGFSSKEGTASPQFQVIKNNSTTTFTLQDDCHILTGPQPYPIQDWIGAGFAYKTFVKFNPDSLLDAKKVIYGEFTFKALNHFGMRDSLEIGIKELLEEIHGFDTPTRALIALKKFSISDTIFSIDIVHHLQRIIDYPDSNFGFFIYISPENYDISRIEIIPNSYHLKVGYILPPEPR